MTNFAWTCPYCSRAATVTDANRSANVSRFYDGNKHGTLAFAYEAITCPNSECKEVAIKATLRPARENGYGPILQEWQLRPASEARVYPDYIPAPIREDYEEACLIRDLSAKASATLSRRCLQGIIRDYWGISRARLVDEINELKDKVDPATWSAIDAVRSIGNIGAHMERDINVIVEVEPEEAQLLIGLIEILLKDWYIARHERQMHLANITALAAAKKKVPGGS